MLTPTEWTLVTELTRDHLVDAVEPRYRLAESFPSEFVADLSLGTRASTNAASSTPEQHKSHRAGPAS